jgi:hypothetical protein
MIRVPRIAARESSHYLPQRGEVEMPERLSREAFRVGGDDGHALEAIRR